MDMQKKALTALITTLLKADDSYATVTRTIAARGVLEDDDKLTDAEKADKKAMKEEIYQQKAKKAGGDQLAAARVKDWKELTGHERDRLQAARNVTKNAVDACWKRLRNSWKDIQRGDAEKEAGAPVATVAKLLMDRWKEFDIAASKGNKKSNEVPADRLKAILDGTAVLLDALVQEVKATAVAATLEEVSEEDESAE